MESFADNEILSLLWVYRNVVALGLSTMMLVIISILWWDKVRYFFLNMHYGMPMIGKIANINNKDQTSDNNGWFTVEKTLCDDFYSYYIHHNKSVEFYKVCRDYLSKCQEIGRRKKGFFLSSLLIFLILFEAVGFAYVLAPFMVQNVSANDAQMLAWFTAFLLSIAAVFLTDKMGEEIHHNSLIKKIRAGYENDRPKPKTLEPDNRVTLETNDLDSGQKSYIQMLNRVPHNVKVMPANPWTWIAVIYVVVIAIGAFEVRSYTLDSIETATVNNVSPFASTVSPFDLPIEAASFNQAADKKAVNEQQDAVHMASLTTFIILSVIFVAIQVLGIMFGYLYSLSGAESTKAWKYTKDFNNSEEFENFYQRQRDQIARDAQAKLSALQEVLSRRITTSGHDREIILKGFGHKTFDAFLQDKQLANERKKANTEYVRDASMQNDVFEPNKPPAITGINDNVSAETSAESNVVENTSTLNNLPDLSDLNDASLVEIAEGLGIEVEKLFQKRKVQRILSQQKA